MDAKFITETNTHYVFKFLFFKIKIRKKMNNKIILLLENGEEKVVKKVKGIDIKFKGDNSVVKIGCPVADFRDCTIYAGNNCQIFIDTSEYFIRNTIINASADNSTVKIGKDCYSFDNLEILLHREPNLSVTIGDRCMFGTNVVIRTSDAHTITDLEGNVINFGKNVVLKDHVWCAMNTTVLKGVTIAENSCVATGAIVSKDLPIPNSIYGGIPAKQVKTGINWDKKTPVEYVNCMTNSD